MIASPYLGLVRVGVTLASDRYSYAPMMAWVVLGCAGLCRLAQRRWSRPVLLGAGAGTLAVACGLMACARPSAASGTAASTSGVMRSSTPRGARSCIDYMGSTFADAGKLDRAIAEFREALRIRPDYVEATCDLGVALDRRGETDAGVACLREAAVRPEDAKGPPQPGRAPWCTRGMSTRRSRCIARRSGFSRTSPISTSIWASPCSINGRSTRRSTS